MAVAVQSFTSLTFAGSNPAAQNLTIPADNKATIVWMMGYSAEGLDVSTLTLDGNNPDATGRIVGDGGADTAGAYVAVWFDMASGTRALDPLWNSTPTEGPLCQILYLSADDSLSFVDADADSQAGDPDASTTSTSTTGDYAVAQATKYGGTPTHNGVSIVGATQTNSYVGQLFTLTAGASSTTATAGDDFSSVALIILREDSGPPPPDPVAPTPQSGLAFTGGMGMGFRALERPSRREMAGSVQFARTKSGLIVPRRLAA